MEIRIFRQGDYEDVLTLWERCSLNEFSGDPELDIERKLQCGADLFLVAEVAGRSRWYHYGGYDGIRGTAVTLPSILNIAAVALPMLWSVDLKKS
ncbi:hypothetical protein MASR2M36_38000 [Providencia sp.]